MNMKQAKHFGVVTKGNSKIHGSTFSTDPLACNVGQKLRNIAGSTCQKCYAIKLGKVYKSAQKSWEDNLYKWVDALETDPVGWIEAVSFQINRLSENKMKKGQAGAGLHRWFAAGDIPSVDALRSIVEVCKRTPNVRHWLPTREKGIVNQYLSVNPDVFPENLTVRVSAAMIDGLPPESIDCTSTVHKDKPAVGMVCPAYSNGGSFGPCTACWDKSVKNVSYKVH